MFLELKFCSDGLTVLPEIQQINDKVTSVAFSPDGQILASGSDDHTMKLWDLQTGLQIVTLSGHEPYVQSVAFSPDGKTLVSGGFDNTVKVWQVQ